MWQMIPSLQACVDPLAPAFTQPSFLTCCELLLGWAMCLGQHTLLRVSDTTQPQAPPDRSQRHGRDRYYNFYERASWAPADLACRVLLLILTRLNPVGRITLLVDDTLSHKRGKSVWGIGWFRDAVASTQKRVATASGHNWVVLAIAVCVPGTSCVILALPVLARLHRKGSLSCQQLARQMLDEVLAWFPHHRFTLVGDGAYACKEMLTRLDARVVFVGRMRGDAAVYDPVVPVQPQGKRGRKPSKGPRQPSPKEAAARADRGEGSWLWQALAVTVYGCRRALQVVSYQVVWPHVLGLRPILVVVVRDTEGAMKDAYLFTTDLQASPAWVITQFAWRWSIEVLFRASKQVLDIEAPQHWCQGSVERVAPWVWAMQSVLMVWYLTEGKDLPEAQLLRDRMGDWDSEWSLRHMLRVLQHATVHATFNPDSDDPTQLRQMLEALENWALMAA
jgi:hypothetical protein